MSNSRAERLDDDAEAVKVPFEDGLPDRGAGQVHPSRADVGDGGDLGDLDLPLGGALEVLEQAVLAGVGQGDRDPFAAGPADAADPVDVGLGLRGRVVVDDVREMLDIQATGGDVGGDQQVGDTVAEGLHHAVALLLRHPAVQGLGAVAARAERLGELVDLVAAPAEDDRRARDSPGRAPVPARRPCRPGGRSRRPGGPWERLRRGAAPWRW